MLHIKADEQLFTQAGDVKFGIIHYEGMEAGNIPSMLVGRLQLYIENLHTELQTKLGPNIQELLHGERSSNKQGLIRQDIVHLSKHYIEE